MLLLSILACLFYFISTVRLPVLCCMLDPASHSLFSLCSVRRSVSLCMVFYFNFILFLRRVLFLYSILFTVSSSLKTSCVPEPLESWLLPFSLPSLSLFSSPLHLSLSLPPSFLFYSFLLIHLSLLFLSFLFPLSPSPPSFPTRCLHTCLLHDF